MAKSSKFLLVFSKGREVVTTAPTMRHLVSQLLYWGTCSDPRDKVKLQIISWPVICWTGKKEEEVTEELKIYNAGDGKGIFFT